MAEFLKLLAPGEALALLLANLELQARGSESIPLEAALHRVTARPIVAPHGLPEFSRATVDGYALIAGDTFGASGSQPSYVTLIGEAPMGAAPNMTLGRGQCVAIHTGGMLPAGADAVVMLENTQVIRKAGSSGSSAGEIEIFKALAAGDNVINPGEDVQVGERVIEQGREIRAPEVGGLAALGLTTVDVRRMPRVGIISTGDEVVPPDVRPLIGQVRDVNAPCLAALIADHGGEPVRFGIVTDEPGRLLEAADRALQVCDMLVITAGSSASVRDLTAETIRDLGAPGVLVHGVNIRPGKPTILGVCGGKPVIGLPGNPVSAFVIARLFVLPVVARLLGLRPPAAFPTVHAELSVNLASQAGREDWWPVRLAAHATRPGGIVAEPVFGRSNLIFNLVRADGLIRIAPEANGIPAGELVQVLPI